MLHNPWRGQDSRATSGSMPTAIRQSDALITPAVSECPDRVMMR